MKLNVATSGLKAVMGDFSEAGLLAKANADKVTETYARKMANEAGDSAPVLSGDLRANLIASPRRISLGTWEFGGTLPYTRKQEYENASKKGFIRKAVWNNRTPYRDALKREVAKL